MRFDARDIPEDEDDFDDDFDANMRDFDDSDWGDDIGDHVDFGGGG